GCPTHQGGMNAARTGDHVAHAARPVHRGGIDAAHTRFPLSPIECGRYPVGMTNPPITAAAVVLAAGESARMGSPKALLDWGGRPLLEHVLDTAREAGCSKLFVVLGREAESIRAGCKLDSVTVLVNPDPSRGQVSSTR